MLKAQKNCPEIKLLIKLVEANKTNKGQGDIKDYRKIYAKRCVVIDGVLLAHSQLEWAGLVPVIPRELRQEMLLAAHAGSRGHLRNPRFTQLLLSYNFV